MDQMTGNKPSFRLKRRTRSKDSSFVAKKKKIKTQVGDLFAISIGNGQYCFGQAVGAIVEGEKTFPYTFIVYDLVGGLDTLIEKIRSSAIVNLHINPGYL